jgi:hypothetical protein
VQDVEAKRNVQFKEKGEAQTATQLRDEAFEDLQDWMSDFIAIAHIAMEDQSQYLEMLGIVEPSQRRELLARSLHICYFFGLYGDMTYNLWVK